MSYLSLLRMTHDSAVALPLFIKVQKKNYNSSNNIILFVSVSSFVFIVLFYNSALNGDLRMM